MTRRYIITLTAIPPRFHRLDPVLRSLLAQSVAPERVILYLSRRYRRFPDWDGTPPQVPEGVEIRWTDEDWGPATKVLPALKEFAGQDIEILFCDDDQIQRPWLAETLLRARRARPEACICGSGMKDYPPPGDQARRRVLQQPRVWRWRKQCNPGFLAHIFAREMWMRATGRAYFDPPHRVALRAGHADGFEGWMGVLVRPDFFAEEVFDIPEFARPVDDVWLSGQAMRAGHPVWVAGGLGHRMIMPEPTEDHHGGTALYRSEFGGVARDASNLAVVRYFQETHGIWC